MRINRTQAKQVVATYAVTLFEAAAASGSVDLVGGQLAEVVTTVRGHADLRDALMGDTVPAETRGNIAREVFGALDPALVATLGVMAERDNMDLLSSVAEAYADVADERRDVVTVEVTTVVELTDALREAIKGKLASDFGRGIVLREKVDPSIVGGIVISTGGQRLDASISSQLEAARVALSTAHTGGDA